MRPSSVNASMRRLRSIIQASPSRFAVFTGQSVPVEARGLFGEEAFNRLLVVGQRLHARSEEALELAHQALVALEALVQQGLGDADALGRRVAEAGCERQRGIEQAFGRVDLENDAQRLR